MACPMSSTSVPHEGFTDHLYMNPSYSMQENFHGSAARKSLKTEDLPFYHRGQQRVGEEVLAVQLERPLFGMGKPRLHWTPELHHRFVRAVVELGGLFCARPKAILSKMNVKGLTVDQIKSHLQKVRKRYAKNLLHRGIQNRVSSHSPQLSGQGSLTSRFRSTAPVNGKGLGSSQADIGEYENFLQSSETPNYYQNLKFAPWGDYRGNANGSNSGL